MLNPRVRYAPRWTIFLLDLSCCVISLTLAFLLRFNFDFVEAARYPFAKIFSITIVVNICLLIAFKAYAGIVRYTTFEDAGRLLMINGIACGIFLLAENIYPVSSTGVTLFPFSIILIYFLCVNFSQILYRLAVKRIFHYLFTVKKKSSKAAIFSAGHDGMLARKMISDSRKSDFKITAFVDDNEKLIGKMVENLPVMRANYANFEKLKNEGVDLIIIADPYIRKGRLNEVVDICLELNIRVQQVPSTEKWINNTLDTKQLKDINIEQLLEREVINIKNESVGKELRGKKVLVTGAAGSIGSEIVRQVLSHNPAVVIAFDKAETPLHELKLSLPENAPVRCYIGDICDKVRMEQVFEIFAPDIVYHAAAYKHVPLMEEHPSTSVLNNVAGSRLLAELSVSYGVEKFVMISTDKAVNPTNVMGASKRIAEIFTQSYYNHLAKGNGSNVSGVSPLPITKFITTRFGNVLGSNGSVIPRFKKQIEEGGPITVTHPDITRYFMTIPEACRLVLEAGAMGKGGEIFVFDMGSPVKIVDLARKMIRLSGREPEKDIKIVYSGLRPGEKLYEELLTNSENTLPTYHEKILIAQVRGYDFANVYTQIEELIKLARSHVNMETVSKMKEIVPEFVSNNSVYEKLDTRD